MFDFYFVLTLLICLLIFSNLVLFRTNPEVLHRLPLRELRQRLSWPGVGWLGFEERLHLAGNREAVCYAGMEMLMTRGIAPQGWCSSTKPLSLGTPARRTSWQCCSTVWTPQTTKRWRCSMESAAARRSVTAGGRTTACRCSDTWSGRTSTQLPTGSSFRIAMSTHQGCSSRVPMSAHGRNTGAGGMRGAASSGIVAWSAASVMSSTSGCGTSMARWVTPSAGCETRRSIAGAWKQASDDAWCKLYICCVSVFV